MPAEPLACTVCCARRVGRETAYTAPTIVRVSTVISSTRRSAAVRPESPICSRSSLVPSPTMRQRAAGSSRNSPRDHHPRCTFAIEARSAACDGDSDARRRRRSASGRLAPPAQPCRRPPRPPAAGVRRHDIEVRVALRDCRSRCRPPSEALPRTAALAGPVTGVAQHDLGDLGRRAGACRSVRSRGSRSASTAATPRCPPPPGRNGRRVPHRATAPALARRCRVPTRPFQPEVTSCRLPSDEGGDGADQPAVVPIARRVIPGAVLIWSCARDPARRAGSSLGERASARTRGRASAQDQVQVGVHPRARHERHAALTHHVPILRR